MISWKVIVNSLFKSLIYSFIIAIIDIILIIIINSNSLQIIYSLSIILLIEGGILLILGGAVSLYTPSIEKINEVMFHSKPWNAKRQKEIEKQMAIIILTGIVLIIEALIISAF
ncbi:MAG: hypothetical protein P8Y18_11555 [Candidatus Bathyarchaeota archaeon]